MKIRVKLSSLLRQFGNLDGQPETMEMSVSDKVNPAEFLESLADRFPALKKWLYDKEGKLRPVIFVFVNGEKLLSGDFSEPLQDGDEVFVVFSFAGG